MVISEKMYKVLAYINGLIVYDGDHRKIPREQSADWMRKENINWQKTRQWRENEAAKAFAAGKYHWHSVNNGQEGEIDIIKGAVLRKRYAEPASWNNNVFYSYSSEQGH